MASAASKDPELLRQTEGSKLKVKEAYKALDTAISGSQTSIDLGSSLVTAATAYGWKIDQDAEAAQLTEEIRTGTQTTREPVYSMRANSYGYNDIGSTYIEVDLSSQHM